MSLKVIITGATGMVGEGVLQECIANPMIEKILLINRKPTGVVHSKVQEIIHQHFNDLSAILDELRGYDACYFCLGISSLGVKEDTYYDVTYKLTIDFARQLTAVNDKMTFCYVSGAGTDSSEKGKLMWARVKGKTENDLTKLPFKAVYNFRPGFMRPAKGAKNIKGVYKVIDFLYPVFRSISPTYFLTLEEVAKAMINVTMKGYPKTVIEVKDIAVLSKMNT
jgi:uncharacterized protein YbjT (DUF2867 family)